MDIQKILEKHFITDVAVAENIDFQQFRIALIEAIEYLLAHNIERLSQAMYRIDVSEEAFREALYSNNATVLADLAIQRVAQKKTVYPQKI